MFLFIVCKDSVAVFQNSWWARKYVSLNNTRCRTLSAKPCKWFTYQPSTYYKIFSRIPTYLDLCKKNVLVIFKSFLLELPVSDCVLLCDMKHALTSWPINNHVLFIREKDYALLVIRPSTLWINS